MSNTRLVVKISAAKRRATYAQKLARQAEVSEARLNLERALLSLKHSLLKSVRY